MFSTKIRWITPPPLPFPPKNMFFLPYCSDNTKLGHISHERPIFHAIYLRNPKMFFGAKTTNIRRKSGKHTHTHKRFCLTHVVGTVYKNVDRFCFFMYFLEGKKKWITRACTKHSADTTYIRLQESEQAHLTYYLVQYYTPTFPATLLFTYIGYTRYIQISTTATLLSEGNPTEINAVYILHQYTLSQQE